MKENILLVPSGKRVSLIKYLQKEFNCICVDSDYNVASRFVADSFYQVSPWSCLDKFIESITHIIKTHNIKAIIPLLDEATKIILNNQHLYQGIPILGSSNHLNNICFNKKNTYDFFQSICIETPRIISNYDGTKAIARKIEGCGSQGVFILNDENDWNHLNTKVDRQSYIVTEFIEGNEYTVDCFKDVYCKTVAIVPRLRERVNGGEVERASVVLDQHIIETIKYRIMPNLCFYGAICVQLIKRNNKLYFIEINDRCGGGLPLSIEAGVDFNSYINDIIYISQSIEASNIQELKMIRANMEFYEEVEQ